MYKYILSIFTLVVNISLVSAQGFDVKTKGVQTFNFADENGANQAAFHSSMAFEDINGTANGVSGKVSFDPADFAKTLKGKIIVTVESMKTGIGLRDEHLKGANWLDADDYPNITFNVKSVSGLKKLSANKLSFIVTGDFSLHGVTKEITADADATYLEESAQTEKRAPGDLLGIHAKFTIKLSDYGIENEVIGSKVAENIAVTINVVGSNKIQ